MPNSLPHYQIPYLGIFRCSAPLQKPHPIKLYVIYHPPGEKPKFFEDITDLITQNLLKGSTDIILRDLHLHLNNAENPIVQALSTLLEANDLTQHCSIQTHNKGPTLDAIISNHNTLSLHSILPTVWSDYTPNSFDFNVNQPKVHSQTIRPKKWARNTDQIPHTELEALVSSQILPPLELTSTDDLTSHYNTKMAEVLDTVAPLKLKKSRCIPSRSWFNKGLNKER